MIGTLTTKPSGWIRAAVASTAALALLTGCNGEPAVDYATEGDAWKTRIAEAMDRTEAANAHRFEGSVVFRLNGVDSPEASLLPLLGDGFAWDGVVYRDPLRLEADLRFPIDGAGSSEQAEPQSMPLLLQDNKLYVSVPMLNESEEYLAVDLGAEASYGPVPFEALAAAADALDELGAALVAATDPEWVRLAAPETERGELESDGQATGSEPVAFAIEVTEENAERLEAAFRSGWSAWSSAFPPSLGAASQPIADGSLEFDLAPGGAVRIELDGAGFVVKQSIDFTFTESAGHSDGAPSDIGKLSYQATRSDIDGAPEMTKTVPEKTLSFDHLLRFLAAGRERP